LLELSYVRMLRSPSMGAKDRASKFNVRA